MGVKRAVEGYERVNQPEMIDKIRAKQDAKNAALGISDIGAKEQS